MDYSPLTTRTQNRLLADSSQRSAISVQRSVIPRPSFRLGLTLVELLVVIVILTILIAAVLPAMAPSTEERRLREAVRGISTFFTQARSRALATGRPAGVWIERMANEPGAAMVLYQAQVPPPFSGLGNDSMLRIFQANNSGMVRGYFVSTSTNSMDTIPPGLISQGDTVQLNHQGVRYVIANLNESSGIVQLVPITPATAPPWKALVVAPGQQDDPRNPTVPYQITRKPVRSSAPPYQLPEGMVIDLFGSGVDNSAEVFQEFPPYQDADVGSDPSKYLAGPILITFSPSGRLDYVQHEHRQAGVVDVETERATSAVHLLIGKRENIPPPVADADRTEENTNWLDLESRWLTVARGTGQVSSNENAAVDPAALTMPWDQINAARRYTRDMRSLGGN